MNINEVVFCAKRSKVFLTRFFFGSHGMSIARVFRGGPFEYRLAHTRAMDMPSELKKKE